MVVAITKCDMPNANPARVRQQLMGRGVELEEAGGSVQVRGGAGLGCWGTQWALWVILPLVGAAWAA